MLFRIFSPVSFQVRITLDVTQDLFLYYALSMPIYISSTWRKSSKQKGVNKRIRNTNKQGANDVINNGSTS